MTIAPSPALFRVVPAVGAIVFEYDVGAGAVQFTHAVGLGLLSEGVVAGNLAANDLLTAMQTDIAAQDPALAGTVATIDAAAWRVTIDVGAGNTLRVMGALAGTTFDLHLFGFDQGANTAAAQVTTSPQAPLGTWASPVPLGGGYLRARNAQVAQAVSVTGRVVTVKRGLHLSTRLDFTDVPESAVFHSGQALAPTVHDADGFERFYEVASDGSAFEYSLDRTVRTADATWVLGAASTFSATRRIDGWPFFSFGFDALAFVT